ncbi:MAG: response regulator transcription factor [Marinoscillum sp.]
MNTKTIFIADDHQLIIDGISNMIAKIPDLELIGYANNGEEALKKIQILKPDLVLMDLDMPKLNGLQATEILLKADHPPKVIILTLHHEKPIVSKLMNMGVSGYILKNTSQEEFIQGIQMVLNGSKFYSSQLTESIVSASSLTLSRESNVRLLSLLNDRERSILKLLAEGASSKIMAAELHLSEKTIESYRKALLKKLDAKNAADLIRISIKEGLIDL